MTEGELLELLRDVARGGRSPELGVVGGTFDPVHVGHTAMGDAALAELGLDALLYLPAGSPSFKLGRDVAPRSDRLAMVRLAVAGRPRCAVSAREVERPGTTYTVDTLEELGRACPPGTRLTFVVGADALATLPLWHRAADLARLARFAAAGRAGCDLAVAAAHVAASGLGFDVALLSAPLPDVSSTQVRESLAHGEDPTGLLEPAVARYIDERGLYAPVDGR